MENIRNLKQEDIEKIILSLLKGIVEDAWFEPNEVGSRLLHIKPFPAIEELRIKVGGTE